MRGQPALRELTAPDRLRPLKLPLGGDQQSPCVRDHTKWTEPEFQQQLEIFAAAGIHEE